MAIGYATDSTDVEVDDGETVQIPASIVGDAVVGPGDVIKLEVVSNDEDSEMIVVKYATPKKREPMPKLGGIADAAAEFEA